MRDGRRRHTAVLLHENEPRLPMPVADWLRHAGASLRLRRREALRRQRVLLRRPELGLVGYLGHIRCVRRVRHVGRVRHLGCVRHVGCVRRRVRHVRHVRYFRRACALEQLRLYMRRYDLLPDQERLSPDHGLHRDRGGVHDGHR